MLGGLLVAALTYTARHTLNADGVSYLDLAARLRDGDVAHFIQGYWSPLYPALLALASLVTGLDGARLIPTVHLINGLFGLGALSIIWTWARQRPGTAFPATAVAALLLCSSGAPRVEAITPDLLLLLVLTGLTYELIVHEGKRWFAVGLLLGLAFLAKTSTWPWLLVAAVVRLLVARDWPARQVVVRSILIGAAVMLMWIVPMSVKNKGFTPGAAGRLNACWYLHDCDSRTPDTHAGTHVAYRDATISGGERITWAGFDEAARWTYQPWSDPTEWEHGVGTRLAGVPDAPWLLTRWANTAAQVFGRWLLPLLLAVFVPVLWISWRPGMWLHLVADHRGALVTMILGMVGLAQFIAVHAEPRLIAPFALMLALGFLDWMGSDPLVPVASEQPVAKKKKKKAVDRGWRASGGTRQVAASIGCAFALVLLAARIGEGAAFDRHLIAGSTALEQTVSTLAERGIRSRRIAIVGPAMPVTAAAYWIGGHIVAQIPPRSAGAFAKLTPAVQQQFLNGLFAGRADVAWVTNAAGQIQMIAIQAPPGR